jgi:hypothetical protein
MNLKLGSARTDQLLIVTSTDFIIIVYTFIFFLLYKLSLWTIN